MYRLLCLLLLAACATPETPRAETPTSGNPIFEGWYADPEGIVFDDEYWIFPTYSDDFEKQLHLDAFSSKDLVNWTKHSNVLDTSIVKWVRQAMWAPSIIEHRDQYWLFFAGNDVQRPSRDSWD